MQAEWLFLLTDVPNLFTANPSTNPDAEPIWEVHDLSKLHVRTRYRGPLIARAPRPLPSAPLTALPCPAPLPPPPPPGGHEHERHAVGHGRHGDQADGGAHRHRRRLPHGHLLVGRPRSDPQDHCWRAHRHRVPLHRAAHPVRAAGRAGGQAGGGTGALAAPGLLPPCCWPPAAAASLPLLPPCLWPPATAASLPLPPCSCPLLPTRPSRSASPPACSGRKRWILSVPVRGEVWLDEGAQRAVQDRKKSLFSAGIVKVVGDFEAQARGGPAAGGTAAGTAAS